MTQRANAGTLTTSHAWSWRADSTGFLALCSYPLPMPQDSLMIIVLIIIFAVCAHHVWTNDKKNRWLAVIPASFAISMLWDNFLWVRQLSRGLASQWGFEGYQGAVLFSYIVWLAVVYGALKYMLAGKAKS
jgi:hypothetical protein